MAIIRNFRLPIGIGISADYIETFGIIESVSPTTGAIVSQGGLGVQKNIFAGANVSIAGSVISGSWAGNAITGRYGGTGYTNYTKGDLLVGAGGTFIKQNVGANGSVLVASSSTGTGLTWRSSQFGNFSSTTTQQVYGANIPTPITVNDIDSSVGFSIMGGSGTSSRIQIAEAGVYNIMFSAQLNLVTGNQPQVCTIWLKKNGVDIPNSSGVVTITGHNYYHIASWNYIDTFTAGQYFEFYFSSADLHMQVEAITGLTSPTRPDSPSMAITVQKVL